MLGVRVIQLSVTHPRLTRRRPRPVENAKGMIDMAREKSTPATSTEAIRAAERVDRGWDEALRSKDLDGPCGRSHGRRSRPRRRKAAGRVENLRGALSSSRPGIAIKWRLDSARRREKANYIFRQH